MTCETRQKLPPSGSFGQEARPVLGMGDVFHMKSVAYPARATAVAAAALLSAGAAVAAEPPANLPKHIAVTAYDVGSSGYAQAVAVGAAFKNNYGVTLRVLPGKNDVRSEEHTSELQSLMRTSYAVF